MLFSEPILFRTRTVILTDQRLFIDGTMVPLEDITAVRTARPGYFWPLLLGRLLGVGGIVCLLVLFREQITNDAGILMLALPIAAAVLLGALVFWSLREIPTHVVQIETGASRINVMHVYETGRARLVAQKIRDAMQGKTSP